MHASDRNAVNGPRMDATDVDVEPIKGLAVSCKTAFSCLDRICGSDGTRMATAAIGWVADAEEGVLPLDRLIAFSKTRGLRLRPASFDWGSLLVATATKTILLLLNNGNVVAVLGTGREGVEEVVVSDPLYREGEPFFLPRLALEQAWGGEALLVKTRRSKGERALAWYFSILSVFGLAAGLLLLSQAAVDVTIAGSHSSEDSAATSSRESTQASAANHIQPPAAPAESETRIAPRLDPAAGAAAPPPDVAAGAEPSRDPAAASTGAASELKEQPAEISAVAALPTGEAAPAPATAQIAARIDQSATRLPEPLGGSVQQPPTAPSAGSGNRSTKPASPAPSASEIATLLARGDALIAKGDLASARLFYERAAEASDGQAALRLGESYDPAFLAQAHLSGVRGDAVAG